MTTDGPRGIGGWLILPIVGLVLTPVVCVLALVKTYSPIFARGYWSALTTPGADAYHPLWAPVLLFEIAGNITVIIASLVLLRRLARRSPTFPSGMVVLYLAIVCFTGLDFFFSGLIPAVAVESAPDAAREFGRALGAAVVWVPYFRVSKRVRATFVEVPKSVDEPLDRAPTDQPPEPTALPVSGDGSDRVSSVRRGEVTLNGWQRLWVVFGVLAGLALVVLAWDSGPTRADIYRKWGLEQWEGVRQWIVDPESYWAFKDKLGEQSDSALVMRLNRNARASRLDSLKALPAPNVSQIRALEHVEAIRPDYEGQLAGLKYALLLYWSKVFGLWAAFVGVVYLLGWSIGWVLRGFFPRRSSHDVLEKGGRRSG